ncbi:MAG: ATP-binding cassette domain-containing protein [Dactylosporangium sp.]|nr:ATP-binding cassette domain-containing protein [Dactylosporangium sp.]NNJ63079.1 ATP-binding cassette domain-containing protein [Dactylosporangium sp.]
MTAPLLDAQLIVCLPAFRLDLRLAVAAGETVAVLGPNGAGKTTALRALAGLLALDAGHLDLAGRRLDDPATGWFVPARHRGVGFVFADHLLFPYLSALDNVAFGLRCQGRPRREARTRALGFLDRVGLADLSRRRPGELSRGQSQRVALARALAIEPPLLLLDEPLASLDPGTREEIRAGLRAYLSDHTGATVLVTHDPLDASALADRSVFVDAGRVAQPDRRRQARATWTCSEAV